MNKHFKISRTWKPYIMHVIQKFYDEDLKIRVEMAEHLTLILEDREYLGNIFSDESTFYSFEPVNTNTYRIYIFLKIKVLLSIIILTCLNSIFIQSYKEKGQQRRLSCGRIVHRHISQNELVKMIQYLGTELNQKPKLRKKYIK